MSFWETVKYFKSTEFDSNDEPGSGFRMSHLLVKMLDDLRAQLGEPMIISSGYRTRKANDLLIEKGARAVKNSSHLDGMAVDILCPDSSYRFALLNKIFSFGFLRIGVAKNFIHLDIDPTKAQPVCWVYEDS